MVNPNQAALIARWTRQSYFKYFGLYLYYCCLTKNGHDSALIVINHNQRVTAQGYLCYNTSDDRDPDQHIRAVTSPPLVIAAFTLIMTFVYDRYSGDVHQLNKEINVDGRDWSAGFIIMINSLQTLYQDK